MDWATIIISMAPQHLIIAGVFVIMLFDMLRPYFCKTTSTSNSINVYAWIAIVTLIISALTAFYLLSHNYTANTFVGQFSVTPLRLSLITTIIMLALPAVFYAKNEHSDCRFYMLILASIYGATLIPTTDSFVSLFLVIEIMAIPVYALVIIPFSNGIAPSHIRTSPTAPEAAIKYITLGAVATATFLMAVAFFSGASASPSLSINDFVFMGNNLLNPDLNPNAYQVANIGNSSALLSISLILLLVALFIKSSIAPFHTWAPDAYGASTLSTTAYMSVIIKAGVFFAALRVFAELEFPPSTIGVLFTLPLLSMLWGNIAAINQTNFRRFIGYSSVAHAGYMFFAFLGDDTLGRIQAVCYYAIVYGFASFLAFLSLQPQYAPQGLEKRDALINIKGLYYRAPFSGIMLSIAMLSLAGLPPLPGFVGKFIIFKNVLAAGHTIYAVLGLLASFVGIYIYIRIVQLVFTKSDKALENHPQHKPIPNLCISLFCLLILIFSLIQPQLLLSYFN